MREMIRVRMRHQNRIEPRQGGQRDAGRGDAAENPRETAIEIGIGQHAHAADLDQQRRVPDVRYPRAGAALVAGGAFFAAFARSLDRNHCCGSVAMFWTA